VLICSGFDSEHATTVNIFEVAVRKFVSPFRVFGVPIVDSQMPFGIFTESVQADKFVFIVCRRTMLTPRAFAIRDDMRLSDQVPGKCKGLIVQFDPIPWLNGRCADQAEQNRNCYETTVHRFENGHLHRTNRKFASNPEVANNIRFIGPAPQSAEGRIRPGGLGSTVAEAAGHKAK
jgi:hypothetical protein